MPPDRIWDADPELCAQAAAERERYSGDGAASSVLPDVDYVRQRTSLNFWHDRELPPVDPLLGELVTTTSRILLVGPTGRGKTNILMAQGIAIADGADFLHWRGCRRPRRVLYIDGEMSRRLFKVRLDDAVRRHGNRPPTFFAFSREDFEDMPPLDTPEGQKYIDHVIEAIGGVDLINFDNIQALTIGDLREPESWRKVIPWTRDLTGRCIGQIWAHHTGHNESRGYGDKTREWGLDTVALMEEIECPGADIAFRLKFHKSRERTPDNRADFKEAVITLANDTWSSEPDGRIGTAKKAATDLALDVLNDEIARGNGTIPAECERIPPATLCLTVGAWRKAYELRSLAESKEAAKRAFYRAAKDLIEKRKLVAKHDLLVWPVH